MILEMKAMFTVINIIMTALVIGLLMNVDFFLAFLLIMGMMFAIIGEFFLHVKMISSQANRMLEPNKADEEKCILFDMAQNFTIQRTKKKEEGKREFVRYGKEATIINRGKYPIRLPNGDRGFVGHEDYDMDVDLYECAALDKLQGDDIKEIYYNKMKEDAK